MSKIPKPGEEYSRDREWAVILEDLRSQFRVFGEGLENVQKKLEKLDDLDNRLAQVEENVAMIKSAFRPFILQVSDHEHRITNHEKRLTVIEKAR